MASMQKSRVAVLPHSVDNLIFFHVRKKLELGRVGHAGSVDIPFSSHTLLTSKALPLYKKHFNLMGVTGHTEISAYFRSQIQASRVLVTEKAPDIFGRQHECVQDLINAYKYP